ncbi:MAG: T9SS type A sorting domain-containing protein, partial [Bacteroidia bacterium]
TYTVYYSIGNIDCLSEDGLVITVVDSPLPNVTTTNVSVCEGLSAVLNAQASGGTGNFNYAWSPSSYLTTTSGATVTASPPQSTMYTVTVSDANNCSSSATVNVNVIPLPIVNAGSDIILCDSLSPFPLDVSSPSGGTWSGNNVSPNGIFTPNGTGQVTLTYLVTQNGCAASDQVNVNVINPSLINAGADQSVCQNTAAFNLIGMPEGGIWSGTSVTPSGVFTPSALGFYTLTYSLQSGNCNVSDTKVITVLASPSVTVADATICAGQNTTLTANGSGASEPYTYSWSPSTGLSGTTGASVTANPTSTQTYTVTITSANTCTSTDQATVTVTPLPAVNAGADVGVCVTANPFTLTGFSPAGGIWSGTGVTSGGVFTPTGPGQLTLTYTVTQNGCTASDNKNIEVVQTPTVDAGNDLILCQSNIPFLLPAATPSGGSWSGGGGLINNGYITPTTNLSALILTYTYTQNGCSAQDQISISISDTLNVSAGSDLNLCLNSEPVQLQGTPTGGYWAGSPHITEDGFYNPLSPGLEVLSYVFTNTNCLTANDITVFVVDTPNVAFNLPSPVFCANDVNIPLSGGQPEGGIYSGSGIANNQINPSLLDVGEYIITYEYTAVSGCTSRDTTLIRIEDCTGIPLFTVDKPVLVYPNPCKERVNIVLPEIPSEAELSISNQSGQTVFTQILSEKHTNLDLAAISTGIYQLQIILNHREVYHQKIILIPD